MKEFKEMLDQASLILNVNKQLEFFLENIHLCPEFISIRNRIIFTIIDACIIRGEVFITIHELGKDITKSLSFIEAHKRIRAGIWLEFKKMPKKKLNF